MSTSGQEALRLVIGVVEVGGSQSSIPTASSCKKIGFQMSVRMQFYSHADVVAGFFFFFNFFR